MAIITGRCSPRRPVADGYDSNDTLLKTFARREQPQPLIAERETMKRVCLGIAVAIAALAGVDAAEAQVVYRTYYAPATVYYAPQPVPYYVASPVVATPAPVVAAPVPTVTYYRAPTVVQQPVAQVRTRYRPILGGTVSRVRYGYAPVVYP